jgi:uncharacterized protein (TIGR04255 family)
MKPRKHSPLVLGTSPLIFVLAQVRFPQLLSIKERIPAFQDALRKMGYLKLNQREVTQVNRDPQNNIVAKETYNQWEFIDKEGTHSVLADPRFINVNTSDYTVFEDFVVQMGRVFEVMTSCIEPGLIERLGLRFVDLIVPSEGKNMEYYVNQSLRGFQVDPDEDRQAFYMETVTRTGENKRFIHRYTETQKGLGFPPDLIPSGLKLLQNPRMETTFGLLDMDHMITREMDVETAAMTEAFWDLHMHHEDAFRSSVTESALEEWRQS